MSLRYAPDPSHLTPSPGPLCIRTRRRPPFPPWVTHPPLHAYTAGAASCPPHPLRHIGIDLWPPTARSSARGPRRRGDIGVRARPPQPGHAGGADSSSVDADPGPMLKVTLAVDLTSTPGESRTYTYTLLPPATLLPTFKGRALCFSSRVMKAMYTNVCAALRAHTIPRQQQPKHERTSTRRVCARLRGGLLLSGDDLEFRICGLAPASRELTDPYPARTQLRAWGRLRRTRGCEHNGMGGDGACWPTISLRRKQVSARVCSNLRFSGAEHQIHAGLGLHRPVRGHRDFVRTTLSLRILTMW
ncbi:hypothetical protein C8R44DRAFT_901276 [Mycena epipterygia]|nr:hypothetical protein C8R44DRAFT_901276 [Mycena epipterygia]